MSNSKQSLVISRRASRLKRLGSFSGRAALFLITSSSAIAVLFIFYFILKDAIPFFSLRGFKEFFTSTRWYPSASPPEFGALAIFVGSGLVTLGAVIVAIVLGIPAAVCLSDVLPFKLRQILKPVIEMLAAIPSVAYGFFALVIFAPFLQGLGAASGTNALNVSIILGIMALPTVVSVSEDALQAAGRQLREGSYALGATRAETILKVIIPAAKSGILAAVILGVMRAVGETMVVWMASGNAAQIPSPFFNFLEPVRTLTATIAGDMGEADQVTGSARYHVLFAMALCLVAISFLCNLITEWITRRAKRVRG
jgi:phosphate transport system permease protein